MARNGAQARRLLIGGLAENDRVVLLVASARPRAPCRRVLGAGVVWCTAVCRAVYPCTYEWVYDRGA